MPIIIITLILLVYINRHYSFGLQPAFGVLVTICFISTGIYLYADYNQKPAFYDGGTSVAVLLETPVENRNFHKAVARIDAVFRNDSIFTTNETILVYFSKSKPLPQMAAGEIIMFQAKPQPIQNFGNPYEFDYKKYLERKRIYRQIYLTENDWTLTNESRLNLAVWAERTREKLLTIYRQQPLDNQKREILSALTLGYKRNLNPETKRVFSSAGAMHVLAVSGLHVGIIFWVLTLLLNRFRKKKPEKLIFVAISLITLWGYAFITGLAPSVLRATTMFSIFIVAEIFRRKSNAFNSLAVSAFILLLINPNNLFETGFQLSYSAVFGILYLQPQMRKLFVVKNKIAIFLLDLITVSIAAQIATFPLTLFYFGQFPVYFLITNIIIIPTVTILIPMGILLLVLSHFPIIANIIALLLNKIIHYLFLILMQIEMLPNSVIESPISSIQFLFIAASLIAFFILLKTGKEKALEAMLFTILLIFVSFTIDNFSHRNKNELIVYNNQKNSTVQFIHGRESFVISEKPITSEMPILQSINRTNKIRKLYSPDYYLLSDQVNGDHFILHDKTVVFKGKTIHFG
ncbi:MAG: hypothetical protein CR996_02045, partial [Draconibacterium sp.]